MDESLCLICHLHVDSVPPHSPNSVVLKRLESRFQILLVEDTDQTWPLICSRLHTLDDPALALPSIAYLGLKVAKTQSPSWVSVITERVESKLF